LAHLCDHMFYAECWGLWAGHLEKMRVVIKCARCRGVVFGVEDV
jgi:hypothetical protein